MLANAPPVVFCERTGTWAAAWRRLGSRRALRGKPAPRTVETRSASECREIMALERASFVVVEIASTNVEQTLDLLFDLGTAFPGVACAVVAERAMSGNEPLARELGALAFVVSPLELEEVFDLADRHVKQAAREPADVCERIWNELPWG